MDEKIFETEGVKFDIINLSTKLPSTVEMVHRHRRSSSFFSLWPRLSSAGVRGPLSGTGDSLSGQSVLIQSFLELLSPSKTAAELILLGPTQRRVV